MANDVEPVSNAFGLSTLVVVCVFFLFFVVKWRRSRWRGGLLFVCPSKETFKLFQWFGTMVMIISLKLRGCGGRLMKRTLNPAFVSLLKADCWWCCERHSSFSCFLYLPIVCWKCIPFSNCFIRVCRNRRRSWGVKKKDGFKWFQPRKMVHNIWPHTQCRKNLGILIKLLSWVDVVFVIFDILCRSKIYTWNPAFGSICWNLTQFRNGLRFDTHTLVCVRSYNVCFSLSINFLPWFQSFSSLFSLVCSLSPA